jgi:chorismate mutase/prephenate dehydratase
MGRDMARKVEGNSTTPTNNSAPRSPAQLKALRAQIDKLDLQIVKLVNERAAVAGDIGRAKLEQGEDIFSPAREEEVYQNVVLANEKQKGPLDESTIRAVFREIMSGSRALQKVLKVSYLGPEYSFSHLASIERFGQQAEFIPVPSISAVFEEVNREHVEFGVVPVENSTDGRVADTLDMFQRLPHLTICGEVRIRIQHNLVANCEHQEIRRVYSKAQVLSQCRTWLAKNLPNVLLKDVSSTSIAATLAHDEPGSAAIASRQAAVKYGLRVLFSQIEDSPHNETRFAVIGRQKAQRSGNDKTSLMFHLPHNPGSLAEALDVFKQNKINLTWIESFPANQTAKPEYIFFVDCEGHQDDPKISRALKALAEHCRHITVLGSFPMASPVGG